MNFIAGVRVKPLKVMADQRGRLMELVRADDDIFSDFGQVYITTTLPGVIKAWHLHRQQTDLVACVLGMIRLVIYDDRENSSTQGQFNQFFMGVHNPVLVRIPPRLYHGWQCVSLEEALIVNTVTHPYNYQNPDEERLDPHNSHIVFDWQRRDG
ncbi:MAG: dTDP-4-dehydrorhamnose 3,5-epimerase family protein [Desulfarculales bacterium]|jgi:dTDP-4-dehydrorhamnose 3,5-epimerase|nr:dTDP-4-dehydrorhamnose 3,5-epimerase family protein [Desulfarculales bacterium]